MYESAAVPALIGGLVGTPLIGPVLRLSETPPLVQALVDESCPRLRPAMTTLATVLLETLVERHEERIALAGTANLARGGLLDFQGSLRPILEALEEEVILLKLIGEVEPSTLRVRIGDENEIDNLRAASVVSTGYGPGATIVGGLGTGYDALLTVGPTLLLGIAVPLKDIKTVRMYESEILNHVQYLLSGHMEELPKILQRAEETVRFGEAPVHVEGAAIQVPGRRRPYKPGDESARADTAVKLNPSSPRCVVASWPGSHISRMFISELMTRWWSPGRSTWSVPFGA